ncbi:PREDICTED: placenta-expressed transcript 1 protein-like [Nanorana parkeri]|uniref:placenta-expressed transcript 1 protein-like n=1 Tax=Nanorana parkeri TaxID=125878 RepID=UPI0008543F9D|nr:PREDICTED: placenta-expressed transcript 1 protein-like [Nanorana parkeri]
MSFTGYTALLLLLGVITPGYTTDPEECNFTKKTAENKDYKLTVSPKTLYNNTVYTVNVTGNGNESVKVLLQALSNNTVVGNWSIPTQSVDCSGKPLLNFTFNANNSLFTNWTSPSSSIPDSVDINVFITKENVTYTLSEKLHSSSANAIFPIHPLSVFLTSLLVITSKLL